MTITGGEWPLECWRESFSSVGGVCALSKSGVVFAAQFRWYHDFERPIDNHINGTFFMEEGK